MKAPSAKVAGAGIGLGAVLALALPLVAAWEGLRLDPYRDLAGVATVCRGETHVEMRHYTREECDVMLERSLLKHATPILECLPADAPVSVKAAFVSWGYNVGVSAACGSSAAKKARSGDYAGACSGLGAWIYVKGRKVQGLVNRRAAEMALCRRGLS
jgi:lysozyme